MNGKLSSHYTALRTTYTLCRTEGVPADVHVRGEFELQYKQTVEKMINDMNAWAEKPLQGRSQNLTVDLFKLAPIDCLATREDSAKGTLPVFPLNTDDLDSIPPKDLAQTVASFLLNSYCTSFC